MKIWAVYASILEKTRPIFHMGTISEMGIVLSGSVNIENIDLGQAQHFGRIPVEGKFWWKRMPQ